MTPEMMQNRRKELGMTLRELSLRSGAPVTTVQKIFRGTTASPRLKTVQALDRALREASRESTYNSEIPEETFVAEVPVHVLNDECLIDFREVWDSVAFLYEEEEESETGEE